MVLALPEKWDKDMCSPEDQLAISTPHFSIFSVLKTLFSPPNYKFLEILNSKASKLAKSSVSKPQIGSKVGSHGYILLRNSLH